MKSLDKIFEGLSIKEMLERDGNRELTKNETVKETKVKTIGDYLEMSYSPNFYVFKKEDIAKTTTEEYRKFLFDAGYAPLNGVSYLIIAKDFLRLDSENRELMDLLGIETSEDKYVCNINHEDAKRLVNKLGFQLLTTQLMYNLFIPYLKNLAKEGNTDAQKTLGDMKALKAEWLEDLLIRGPFKDKLKIGTNSKKLSLPYPYSGFFSKTEMNEFGYPRMIIDSADYKYTPISSSKTNAIRDRSSFLNLSLGGTTFFKDSKLSVRCVKFINLGFDVYPTDPYYPNSSL